MDTLSDLREVLDNQEDFDGIEYEVVNNNITCVAFKLTKYASKIFENMREFQQEKKFCDIKLRSKDSDVITYAHKLVLASVSPYFKAMFAGGFKEDHECHELSFDHINHQTLETVIEFVYTSRIILNEGNVHQVMMASKMLQIETLSSVCCLFIGSIMNADNCIFIEHFSRDYGCINLAKKAQEFILANFCKVANSEDFLQLNNSQLTKLIRHDELGVPCESVVFQAVVNWVKHEPENRRCFLDHLFRCVRFHFLPPKFLKEQMNNNDLLHLSDTLQTKQYLQDICDQLISHSPCISSQVPRKPMAPFALYVVGGYQRQSISTVECFKGQTMAWERCADMKIPRSGICCVSLALYIYAIGGRNNNVQGNTDCADVECFDPFTNFWRECAPMNIPRSRAGAGIIDGFIYVAGGAYGNTYHASLERYSPLENRWELLTPMNVARNGLGCTVVNRLLYAIGGFNGVERVNTVECYNPDQNLWTFLPSMNTVRSGAGVVSFGNSIYVIGGYSANQQLNSVERFDILTNQWTFIAPMNITRSAAACAVWNSKIMAMGGYDGNEFLSSVELYDLEEKKWELVIPLTSERSGHAAVVSVEKNSKMN